ncbi:MBL fold metallo-hydrolase [Xanthomarina sp. GH4-25]|uniref:MBL fold metallo-hydrolase n=1 Tax=Xanthomarina sp. GH4-25 TaxID=3349335 RepID=UPI003877E151
MKYLKTLSLTIFIILNSSCTEAKTKKETNKTTQTESKTTKHSDFIQQKITDNLYILKNPNYNTNVGVYIGEKEILLVDPMTGNNNQEQLLNAIKQLSEKPVTYVINTHHHMDHSGANTFFKDLGATIISQENTKYTNATYDVTFKDTYTLNLGNETIELYHTVAHTFDDVLVHFKSNNVVFMGDTYMTNSFPHFYYGGGSKGHLSIIDKALALGDATTAIVPAHGNLTVTKNELTTYRESSVKWMSRIKQLHSEGKNSDAIADDAQIQQLSMVFNDGKDVSKQNIQRTIDKTIAVDFVDTIELNANALKNYEGIYQYENGQVDEIILQNGTLILRSEGNYMYEIVPILETKFHIKGQFPNKYLTFDATNTQFVFFNGKERLTAKRK